MNLKQIKNSLILELSINQLSHKILCNIINKLLIGSKNPQLTKIMILNKDIFSTKAMRAKNKMIRKFNNLKVECYTCKLCLNVLI